MKKGVLSIVLMVLLIAFTEAKTFVLVHGAMIDGTAWFKVKPLLEAQGAKVVVVNLAAHGKDNTPIANVSFKTYIDAIVDSINAQSEKVILVGHSMAGLLISQVSEIVPNKIEALVFTAAFLPQNGDNVFGLNGSDASSQFGPNLIVAADKASATVKLDKLGSTFCADCSKADQSLLVLSHKAEPTAPLGEKVVLTHANFGKMPKYVIESLDDKAITITKQKELVAKAQNVVKVFEIKTGHLPFISQPEKIAAFFLSVN